MATLGCLDSVVHLGLEACVVVQHGGDLVQQGDNPPHDTVLRWEGEKKSGKVLLFFGCSGQIDNQTRE